MDYDFWIKHLDNQIKTTVHPASTNTPSYTYAQGICNLRQSSGGFVRNSSVATDWMQPPNQQPSHGSKSPGVTKTKSGGLEHNLLQQIYADCMSNDDTSPTASPPVHNELQHKTMKFPKPRSKGSSHQQPSSEPKFTAWSKVSNSQPNVLGVAARERPSETGHLPGRTSVKQVSPSTEPTLTSLKTSLTNSKFNSITVKTGMNGAIVNLAGSAARYNAAKSSSTSKISNPLITSTSVNKNSNVLISSLMRANVNTAVRHPTSKPAEGLQDPCIIVLESDDDDSEPNPQLPESSKQPRAKCTNRGVSRMNKSCSDEVKPTPVAGAEPRVAEPEPRVIQPEPRVSQPEPGVPQPEPRVAEPEPRVAEPEPVVTEPEHEIIELEHEATESVHTTKQTETDCPECSEVFMNMRDRDSHFRVAHGEDKMPFKCKVCFKGYFDKMVLLKHYRRTHPVAYETITMLVDDELVETTDKSEKPSSNITKVIAGMRDKVSKVNMLKSCSSRTENVDNIMMKQVNTRKQVPSKSVLQESNSVSVDLTSEKEPSSVLGALVRYTCVKCFINFDGKDMYVKHMQTYHHTFPKQSAKSHKDELTTVPKQSFSGAPKVSDSNTSGLDKVDKHCGSGVKSKADLFCTNNPAQSLSLDLRTAEPAEKLNASIQDTPVIPSTTQQARAEPATVHGQPYMDTSKPQTSTESSKTEAHKLIASGLNLPLGATRSENLTKLVPALKRAISKVGLPLLSTSKKCKVMDLDLLT